MDRPPATSVTPERIALALKTTRPTCPRCLRAATACICRWAAPLASPVQLLILQHPLEMRQAKGSARLLHLSLPGSRIEVGETFDPHVLAGWLGGPWEDAPAPGPARRTLLLYPDPQAAAPPLPPDLPPAALRLVVLDATWRKSRKMLHQNPLLQALPRLALADMPDSRYRIRKAHVPDQLSTLEATCYALMRLERDEEKFRPLIAAFDGFVAQQASFIP